MRCIPQGKRANSNKENNYSHNNINNYNNK
jgi:hypothetical protein